MKHGENGGEWEEGHSADSIGYWQDELRASDLA